MKMSHKSCVQACCWVKRGKAFSPTAHIGNCLGNHRINGTNLAPFHSTKFTSKILKKVSSCYCCYLKVFLASQHSFMHLMFYLILIVWEIYTPILLIAFRNKHLPSSSGQIWFCGNKSYPGTKIIVRSFVAHGLTMSTSSTSDIYL